MTDLIIIKINITNKKQIIHYEYIMHILKVHNIIKWNFKLDNQNFTVIYSYNNFVKL